MYTCIIILRTFVMSITQEKDVYTYPITLHPTSTVYIYNKDK